MSFDINETSAQIGESFNLPVKEQISVHYQSGDEKVAQVDDNGYVKIVGQGTTYITATANGGSFAACKINATKAGDIPATTEPATTEPATTEPATTLPGSTAEPETNPGPTSSVATPDSPNATGGSTTSNGTVQTSDSAMAIVLLVLLLAATGVVVIVRKKKA